MSTSDGARCVTPPLMRAPLSPEAAGALAAKLKALADPVRLRLFSAIASHVGALNNAMFDGISLPIALGPLIMAYPVLAKVRYDEQDTVTRDGRLLVNSLVLNWILVPALMFDLEGLLDATP